MGRPEPQMNEPNRRHVPTFADAPGLTLRTPTLIDVLDYLRRLQGGDHVSQPRTLTLYADGSGFVGASDNGEVKPLLEFRSLADLVERLMRSV